MFFKRKKHNQPSPTQLAQSVTYELLQRRGIEVVSDTFDDGTPYFELVTGHPGARLTLSRPIEWATLLSEDELKAQIDGWLDSLLNSPNYTEENIEDIDLSERLFVRALPDDATSDPAARDDFAYTRQLVPGMSLLLVIDYPETLRWVTSADIERLPQSLDELYGMAIENTLAMPLVDQHVSDDGSVRWLQGQSLCTSAVVSRVELLAPNTGYGIVFAIPTTWDVVVAGVETHDDLVPTFEKVAKVAGQILFAPENEKAATCPHIFFRSPDGDISLGATLSISEDD
ncbi:hypothetical protein H8R18_03335 [Nanchangia anserum]|uniref:DUF1444 family protein n=1 Tax=Nanchangia anserum TaxID=2692125 RepID=A0A8I0GHQ8_9ACTO|nr:hypothetical protein [Nanchangia anserum]MBD3690184.1 hypothetical protein [Nanchangia anserum]QOX82361.1 hypothetical protein H8R18_03335 [Nanchangia anserum]